MRGGKKSLYVVLYKILYDTKYKMAALTNNNKQSSAFKIDDFLVDKITIMSYQLNPHPLAKLTHIKNNFLNKTEKDLMKLWKLTNPRQDEEEGVFTDSDVFEKYWMSLYEEDKTSKKYLDIINWWYRDNVGDLYVDEYSERIQWFMTQLFYQLYWDYHDNQG